MKHIENSWIQAPDIKEKQQKEIKRKEEKSPLKKSEAIEENLAYLLGDLHFLKNKQEALSDPKNYQRRSTEIFREMQKFIEEAGGQYIENINEIYQKYQNLNQEFLIAWREDPEKVAKLLADKDISLQFDPKVTIEKNDKYANCAIWPYGQNAVSGIKNAFLEGRGMAGPLVTLIATKNNPNNIKLTKPKEHLMKVGDISREAVRIVSGKLTKNDLKFIIIRMQKKFFPEEKLTEKERADNIHQVFRGFIME
jgi:hypothetical protein